MPLAMLLVMPGMLAAQLSLDFSAAGGDEAQRASLDAALNVEALQPGQQAVIAVVLDVADGYHAQSHKPLDEFLIPYRITVPSHPFVTAYAPVYPKEEFHEYETLGRVSVYSGRVIVYIPIQVSEEASPGPLTLTGEARFQICDDQTCFPPETRSWQISTRIVPLGQTVGPNQPELFEGFDPRAFAQLAEAGTMSADGEPSAGTTTIDFFGLNLVLGRDSFAAALLIAFLAGIIFNVMPCVLPVLPLKAMSFYEVAQHSRARSMLLAAVFSAGIIAIFGILAMLVLVLRTFTWGEQFSNPWFIWSIVILLVVMGVGMLGAFSIRLPTAVYAVSPRHDTFTGNFLFGMLAAVLSTPCTAPMFPPLLAWAAIQPMYIGVSSVLMVGVGMAFPYLVLSAFPEMARRFPRTGPWSELVKQMLGFLLLAVAVYFAGGQLIEGQGFWWLVTAVVAWGALFLIIRTTQITQSPAPLIVVTALVVLMVGGSMWFTLRMTGGIGAGVAGRAGEAAGNGLITWQPYSDEALADARRQDKVVLVKFTANWCGNCQYIEATVFKDARTAEALRAHDVIALKADLTRSEALGWPLLRQLSSAGGIPLTAIYTPGREQPEQLASVYTTDTLLQTLDRVAPGSTGTVISASNGR